MALLNDVLLTLAQARSLQDGCQYHLSPCPLCLGLAFQRPRKIRGLERHLGAVRREIAYLLDQGFAFFRGFDLCALKPQLEFPEFLAERRQDDFDLFLVLLAEGCAMGLHHLGRQNLELTSHAFSGLAKQGEFFRGLLSLLFQGSLDRRQTGLKLRLLRLGRGQARLQFSEVGIAMRQRLRNSRGLRFRGALGIAQAIGQLLSLGQFAFHIGKAPGLLLLDRQAALKIGFLFPERYRLGFQPAQPLEVEYQKDR